MRSTTPPARTDTARGRGKPAGIVGGSVGAVGTALAQQHLRNILAYLDCPTPGQAEAFVQPNDRLVDAYDRVGPSGREFLQHWMNAYVAWVKRHAG